LTRLAIIPIKDMIERAPALITDLYELTMAAAYFDNGLHKQKAVFELFVRRLPGSRSYLIAAGLEQVLDYLADFQFSAEQVDYLRRHPSFKNVSEGFFDYLTGLRFTGEVWAMPEGTAAFGMEPLLRISAPLIEAQIVETFLLATINFQTMIASKAARVVTAAQGRDVVEFGTRRAHGDAAGLFAARAAYVGGCSGTSNVEAGHLFGIPTFGTMAHSFVMAFDDEDAAFDAFLKVFPATATVLVDTYEPIEAVRRLASQKRPVPAVRLDSGDLVQLSIQVREILDKAGRSDTKIFASSDLNEHRIADLLSRGGKIDAFGVGTELATSFDHPALSGVYKLVAVEQNGELSMRIKLSQDKPTYPGAKQVWRATVGGKLAGDVISLAEEGPPDDRVSPGATWRPLLEMVMDKGRVVETDESPVPQPEEALKTPRQRSITNLDRIRTRAREELSLLPDELLALDSSDPYSVVFSEMLSARRRETEESIKRGQGS
jgi:nicotinate phosphoribosyltransferase